MYAPEARCRSARDESPLASGDESLAEIFEKSHPMIMGAPCDNDPSPVLRQQRSGSVRRYRDVPKHHSVARLRARSDQNRNRGCRPAVRAQGRFADDNDGDKRAGSSASRSAHRRCNRGVDRRTSAPPPTPTDRPSTSAQDPQGQRRIVNHDVTKPETSVQRTSRACSISPAQFKDHSLSTTH